MKMTYDNLVSFQRWMAKEYPYYPVQEKDWNKMNEYVISVRGLEQLKILKTQIIMGNYMREDIALLLSLMELYASTNPTKERLREKKKFLDFYFDDLLKTHYRTNLIKEGLAVKNPKYNRKFREQWHIFGTKLIHECYRLKKLEEQNESNP